MRSADEIANLLDERYNNGRSRQAMLNKLATMYEGKLVVPLPELDREELPAVANLMYQATEQMAKRLASVFPVTRTFVKAMTGPTAGRKNQRDRETAFRAFHQLNGVDRLLRTRARWLTAYSVAPVLVLPQWEGQNWRAFDGPKWHLADPRGFYPSHDASDPTFPVKDDAIFHTPRTVGWLRTNHPEVAGRLCPGDKVPDDSEVDWIVYVDHEQITTMVTRNVRPAGEMSFGQPSVDRNSIVVAHMPNRTDTPLVVAPGGLSLTMNPIGRFDQVIGMYRRMAEMDALGRIAMQKSIFSEAWAVPVGNSGHVDIVQQPEPLEGKPGIVQGGRIEYRTVDQNLTSRVGIGDLERSIRLTGMIPAEFGGELPTNARTARQGGRLMSNVIDFDLQEMQNQIGEATEYENRLAAMVDKKFFGGFTKTVEVNSGAHLHELTYDPEKLWTTVENKVSYGLAGADSDGTVIGAGQRIGMRTFSKESFMENDPMVKDVEHERDRIASEQVEEAFLARVSQEATLPPDQSNWTTDDFARYVELVRTDRADIIEAYSQVNEEAKQRQAEAAAAAQAQQGAAGMDPMADPAAMMPGVSGAEAPASTAPPEEGMSNLMRNLGALRLSQQTVPGEIPA